MNKTIDNLGFLPLTIDHINFDRDATRSGLNSTAKAINPDKTAFMLTGCELTQNGSDVDMTEGALYYNGETYQVDAFTFVNPAGGVTEIGTYSFDLVLGYDANSKKEYLDGSIFETRQIRKATLVPTPATFSGTVYNTLSRTLVEEVDIDLQAHKTIGDNHDYLPNHAFDGGASAFDPDYTAPNSKITIDTGDANYFSHVYVLGNVVTYNFCLPITTASASGTNLNLYMPSWWARVSVSSA